MTQVQLPASCVPMDVAMKLVGVRGADESRGVCFSSANPTRREVIARLDDALAPSGVKIRQGTGATLLFGAYPLSARLERR